MHVEDVGRLHTPGNVDDYEELKKGKEMFSSLRASLPTPRL